MKLVDNVIYDAIPPTPLPKIFRHIAVVATNSVGMKETGFGDLEACRAFFQVLRSKYQCVSFHLIETEACLTWVVDEKPDLVVLCSKYVEDDATNTKIWFSQYFADRQIAFTGSDRATLEFDTNKSKAKTLLINKGIATAKFFLAIPEQICRETDLPFALPVFIKPLNAANGNGIDEDSIARDFAGYEAKVGALFDAYGAAVLVEEVLPGREFTVAIFDDVRDNSPLIMPVEIIPPQNSKGDRVLGSIEKTNNRELLKVLREPLLSSVSALAGRAFAALGARDFGRIDIKLDGLGNPNFLEANLVPGMTPHSSYFPRACAMSVGSDMIRRTDSTPVISQAMTYDDVVLKIADMSLARENADLSQ
ncbi:MAG: D-alanine--D-alanine ligase [Pseudomonadota bacterium]